MKKETRNSLHPDGFERQVVQNLPFLRKIATKYVKNEEDVKDLVQDTVQRAIKHKNSFRQGTNLRGWLVTVLRNLFINQYHKNRYWKYCIDADSVNLESDNTGEPCANPPSPLPDFDKHASLSDGYRAVLDRIPDESRLLVYMCDYEGFSYRQISEYLRCPVGTVRSRLYRTRKSIIRQYRHLLNTGKI